MLGARLCQAAVTNPYARSFTVVKTTISLRPINLFKSTDGIRHGGVRKFMENQRERLSHAVRRKTVAERAMSPAGDTAFSVGKGAVAGASVVGIGALCYYGLGLSSQPGVLEKSM